MFWHKANIQGANYGEVIYLLQVMDEFSGLLHSSTMCENHGTKGPLKTCGNGRACLGQHTRQTSSPLNSPAGGKKVNSGKSMSSDATQHCGADPLI